MPTSITIPELQRVLDETGVRPDAYSFVSDSAGECYRLSEFQDELGRGWHYYYAERGQRVGLVTFRSEAEACVWFAERVLRDPTVYARGAVPNPRAPANGGVASGFGDLPSPAVAELGGVRQLPV